MTKAGYEHLRESVHKSFVNLVDAYERFDRGNRYSLERSAEFNEFQRALERLSLATCLLQHKRLGP